MQMELSLRADAALSPIYASYKELQSDWRWIHSMDPEAASAADQWVKEHPEQWKELEHMLYYSEANFHKRVALDTLEDVDIKQPRSYNPEAFLPEEVRNAIYDDMRWFDRAKYLPEGYLMKTRSCMCAKKLTRDYMS